MQTLWCQDIFSKGELSPLMYSRVTVAAYYNGLKTATNCITYPQGAIGKRFGTVLQAEVSGITSYLEAFFESFQYLNECVYLLVFIPDNILIYLEGTLVATVTSTGIVASEIQLIDSTVLDSRFRITTGLFKPHDLIRTALAANPLTGFSSFTFTITTPLVAGNIYPVQFTTNATLPITTPQIRLNNTYFAKAITTTTIQIYTTAPNAKAGEDKYLITSLGTGTSNAVILNNWTFVPMNIKNYPVYDFTGGYDSINFTPAAVTGYNIQITASAPIFTSSYVGGSYVGNGGITRIITVDDSTHIHVNIITPFDSTVAIPGNASLLAEPAWSDVRGWPKKCSSFQNRSVLANTSLLPNGLWLSVTNDYDDFDDLETDDDNAISWFPSSDNVNFIRFIVPYRSLTIHTNTGIYSTPLSFEQAVTPTNFSMTLQDSTPATAIQPRGIDNQIVILSGNDVHSMLWDGFNNSYTSTIASIANEHLIRSPHDEAAYIDLNKAGSRYMFIINDNGELVIFQTLISENVQGFTRALLEQPYGLAFYRWVTSSSDGRAWFLNERDVAEADTPGDVAFATTQTLFSSLSFAFNPAEPIAIMFATTTSLPTSSPQLELNTYYWAIGIGEFEFSVYLNQADAIAQVNNVTFVNGGVGTTVTPWYLATKFYIEELSFDVYVDCAEIYNGPPTSVIAGLERFNAQAVQIQGDGYGFTAIVANGEAQIESHGEPRTISSAQIGYGINTVIQPLQVCPPGQLGPKGSSLVFPQHIRVASFMFNDTVGGFINGTPIQLTTLDEVNPGSPPVPLSGVFEMSFMKGWNEINTDPISITHSEPFDIKLIGIFYRIES